MRTGISPSGAGIRRSSTRATGSGSTRIACDASRAMRRGSAPLLIISTRGNVWSRSSMRLWAVGSSGIGFLRSPASRVLTVCQTVVHEQSRETRHMAGAATTGPYRLLIGGDWVDGSAGSYGVVNPATEEVVDGAPGAD